MRVLFFFFQAEDGIRDLVRSRGLGDVYKRQVSYSPVIGDLGLLNKAVEGAGPYRAARAAEASEPVSYTHLTLPTSDLV